VFNIRIFTCEEGHPPIMMFWINPLAQNQIQDK
jgi:hypothetical protein